MEKEECGGISRMWTEILKKIRTASNVELTFLGNLEVKNTTIDYLNSVDYLNGNIIEKDFKKNYFFSKILRLNFINSIFLMMKFAKEVDIFHSTGYSNPLIKPKGLKVVTTIHDMVFWDQSHTMKKGIIYWDNVWGIYHSLKVSDKVITVSETSKNSIIKVFPWAKSKIEVIYHGLPEEFLNVEVQIDKCKYFMFIGGRNEYKNYDLLLRTFSLFVKENPEWKLYVVGQNKNTLQKEKKRYCELGIDDVVFDYGMVSQDVMIELIQKSAAVVIPSLNEGFNFPLIESMACGAPVLSSNIPVSLEIGMCHAQYFENNEESLLGLMGNILRQGVSMKDLENARDHARTFSWNSSYLKLIEVYKSCL